MNYIYLCLSRIKPTDKVLDVGGWAQPLKRADAVIDIKPYATRPANALCQGMRQRFGESRWVVQDICDHKKPWPFKDKEFDYVVCAHTLEDVRDPFYVCEEIQRVGKAGFIECPSRFYEQCRRIEFPHLSGARHHRWIVTRWFDGLKFTFKSDAIHQKKYMLNPPLFNTYPMLNVNYESMFFEWKESFPTHENLDSALGTDGKFYEETVWRASYFADLWDQSQPLSPYPAPFTKASWPRGIRKRTDESLAYEYRMIPKWEGR